MKESLGGRTLISLASMSTNEPYQGIYSLPPPKHMMKINLILQLLLAYYKLSF